MTKSTELRELATLLDVLSGNVGIGTSPSASYKLDVNGAIAARGGARAICFDNLESTSRYGIGFGGYDGLAVTTMFANQGYGSAGVGLGFDNNGTIIPSLIVRPTGYIGISQSNPGAKLEINQTAGTVYNDNNGNALRLEYAGSYATGEIGPMMTFAQEWYDQSTDVVRTGGIAGVKTIGNGAFGGGLAFYAQPNSGSDMNQAMIINHNGYVGIGTDDPHANLTIEDTGNNPQVDIYRAVGGNVDIGSYSWTGLLSSTKTAFAAMGFRSGSLGNGYGEIQFKARNTSGTYQHVITFDGDGHILPETTTQDLGSTSQPWQNIYTQDLNLSNEKRDEGNSVDGTKGNWTIQEGDEHLYIINNKSGKKYRFALEEIE